MKASGLHGFPTLLRGLDTQPGPSVLCLTVGVSLGREPTRVLGWALKRGCEGHQVERQEPWQSPGNLALCKTPPWVYFCQSGTSSHPFCRGAAPLTSEELGLREVKKLLWSQSEKAELSAFLAQPIRPLGHRTTLGEGNRRRLSPRPTTLAARPCPLSPSSPTLDIPEAAALRLHRPLEVPPDLGPHLGTTSLRETTSSYRVETRRNVSLSLAGAAGPHLVSFTRVLAFPPHVPEDPHQLRLAST